jgi:hypothetical protein
MKVLQQVTDLLTVLCPPVDLEEQFRDSTHSLQVLGKARSNEPLGMPQGLDTGLSIFVVTDD